MTDKDPFVAKARAAALFDALNDHFDKLARVRWEARERGLAIPEDVRQQVVRLREVLRGAEIPQDEIDATPGLEPPD